MKINCLLCLVDYLLCCSMVSVPFLLLCSVLCLYSCGALCVFGALEGILNLVNLERSL